MTPPLTIFLALLFSGALIMFAIWWRAGMLGELWQAVVQR